MWSKIKAAIERYRRVFDYAVNVLEESRRANSVPVHFENQNAILFGVTELMKRANQVEGLTMELQKTNQLMNISAVELATTNGKLEAMEAQLREAREEIERLREELARVTSAQ